jgi:hypothetical protein
MEPNSCLAKHPFILPSTIIVFSSGDTLPRLDLQSDEFGVD